VIVINSFPAENGAGRQLTRPQRIAVGVFLIVVTSVLLVSADSSGSSPAQVSPIREEQVSVTVENGRAP
jgi:hypothetical protein